MKTLIDISISGFKLHCNYRRQTVFKRFPQSALLNIFKLVIKIICKLTRIFYPAYKVNIKDIFLIPGNVALWLVWGINL